MKTSLKIHQRGRWFLLSLVYLLASLSRISAITEDFDFIMEDAIDFLNIRGASIAFYDKVRQSIMPSLLYK